ncbi:MAG TPA: hemerythrin domain-containing protein [Kofleriaceae bacterium]|nr:hemerythrin domain-containing protein [Kofleriaceae bacterium]
MCGPDQRRDDNQRGPDEPHTPESWRGFDRGARNAAVPCMKDTIDALELLTSQHDEVEMLFSEIEDSDDSEEKAELFRKLADMLAAHATMEEKLFYPSVMAEDTAELLLEATEEHLAVKRVLADMLEMEPEDDRFEAKLTVLKEHVRHHARDEEEGKLFPILREMLDEAQLAGLGNDCLALFEQLLEREPRMNVPAETSQAAPLDMSF